MSIHLITIQLIGLEQNNQLLITVQNESPSTAFTQSSNVHSLDGENLLGGTPFVAWVDLLNTRGGMEGCVTSGELVGMSFLMVGVPLLLNCGVTRLPVGKAGCSSPGSIDWKLLDALEGINSEMFLSLLSVSNSK